MTTIIVHVLRFVDCITSSYHGTVEIFVLQFNLSVNRMLR